MNNFSISKFSINNYSMKICLKNKKIFLVFFLLNLFFIFNISAQIVHPDTFSPEKNSERTIFYKGSGNYILRERSDFRRYDNGKYVGLVNQEVSSYITPVSIDNYYYYEGNFYIYQATMRNLYRVNSGLDDSIPSKFKIDKSGNLTMVEDHGFPTYRSFPTFSDKKLNIGDTWTGKAERAIDPLNKGIVTKLPINVQYQYIRDDIFKDEPVFVISAQWATRYGMGTGNYYIDWGGDKDLQKATGSHKATIYVSKISGNSLLIQDIVDETFVYSDGNQYQFKGTFSMFTEYPPAIDRTKLIPALRRIADISDEQAKQLAKAYNEDDQNFDEDLDTKINADKKSQENQKSELKSESKDSKSKLENEKSESDKKTSELAKKDNNDNQESKRIPQIKQEKDDIKNASESQNTKHSVPKLNEDIKLNSETDKKSKSNQEDSETEEPYSQDLVDALSKLTGGKEISKSNSTESSKKSSQNKSESTKTKNSKTETEDKLPETTKTDKKENSKSLVTVDNTPAGIRLTIPDLQFEANSAQLLKGETERLDKIAEVLKEIPLCKFLIEGHTAAVGLESGEMQLSIERANAIANAFIQRGIPKERFICRGSGGTKPIADNSTSEGKAKNRRVEITILE